MADSADPDQTAPLQSNQGLHYLPTSLSTKVLCPLTNNQVYSNDEFDLWPVYSGERFRALLFQLPEQD